MKLPTKKREPCTVPGCKFPARHSTQAHSEATMKLTEALREAKNKVTSDTAPNPPAD